MRPRDPGRGRALFACLLVWSVWLGPLAAEDAAPRVAIGIREDAPPFAWKDEDTLAFRGYLKDLCVEATMRAGFHVTPIGVTAKQRAAIIDGDPGLATADGVVTLDLLCDPTTISLARLQKLIQSGDERLTFSPILFVANGSYVMRQDFAPTEEIAKANSDGEAEFDERTGAVRHPGDCACWKGIDETSCAATADYFRAAYVTGTTARFNIHEAVRRDRLGLVGAKVCPVEMPTHAAVVEALCAGDAQYAFGDTDIAQFYAKQGACPIKPADLPLSYEPYALLVSDHTPGFRPRFIAALYEMFADQTVLGRFGTYFPGLTKSSALGILFRINSIPGMRDLPCVRDSAKCDPQGGGGGVGGKGEDEEGQSGQKRQRAPGIALAGGDHGAGAEDQGRDAER